MHNIAYLGKALLWALIFFFDIARREIKLVRNEFNGDPLAVIMATTARDYLR